MISLARHIPLLDKLAVSTSTFCAIHCLCLPIFLGFFPALGTTLFGEELFHVLLLWLVIPLSLVALSLGCRRHRDVLVAAIGLVGLISLILAATFGCGTITFADAVPATTDYNSTRPPKIVAQLSIS